MLSLKNHAAAVLYVAKMESNNRFKSMQLAIALIAGLEDPNYVRTGDVLRIVAETHDLLTQHRLIYRPMSSLVDTVVRFGNINVGQKTSSIDDIFDAMISNIRLMRVKTDTEERLVEWETGLDPSFFAAMENEISKNLELVI
jgi:hypothetical protein